MAQVIKNDKYGYVDKTGKEVVPCQYDEIINEKELFIVRKGKRKWGAIDKTGKEIIPLKYRKPFKFNQGIALVIKSDEKDLSNTPYVEIIKNRMRLIDFTYIDQTGKEVIDCSPYHGYFIKEEGYRENDTTFLGELLAVKDENGKWGFIDKTGKEIIPFEYSEIVYDDDDDIRGKKNGEWEILKLNEK